MNLLNKILHNYYFITKYIIMKLPTLIQKSWRINSNTTRIGLSNSLNVNINRSTSIPILFIPKKCVIETIGKKIRKNQIIASFYNEVTRCEYLFYSPIKGTIVNRNETLLTNLDSIYINKKNNDNWIIDIEHYNENNEPHFEKKMKNDIKTKYHWFY